MPLPDPLGLPGCDVPEPESMIVTSRHEGLAVGAERQGKHGRSVPPECLPLPTRPPVPEEHDMLQATRCDQATVRAEGYAEEILTDESLIGLQRRPYASTGDLPQLHGPVPAGRRDGLAVGTEGDRTDRSGVP